MFLKFPSRQRRNANGNMPITTRQNSAYSPAPEGFFRVITSITYVDLVLDRKSNVFAIHESYPLLTRVVS